MKQVLIAGLCTVLLLASAVTRAWDPNEDEEMEANAKAAVTTLLGKDPGMQRFFDKSAGYVVIPTVGKGGVVVGGARGHGLLYEGGKATARVTLTQITVGFQWGGQAYSEFIFFKDKAALEDFKKGNYELGAQASAVAATVGASADADYSSGVAIFTQAKGGLMYEASVGGQKFKVEPK